MTDHNRTDAFNEAVTAAKSRRQQAVRDAHEEFNTAISKADRERDGLYKAASEAWDAVKSNPNHPEHEEAWVAFEQTKAPTNHGPARRALDAALREADQNYHAELADLGRTHGVSHHPLSPDGPPQPITSVECFLPRGPLGTDGDPAVVADMLAHRRARSRGVLSCNCSADRGVFALEGFEICAPPLGAMCVQIRI
jgi:hypothetical protein